MKKLLMVSDESILSGYTKSGIAEVVDSLANSLTEYYDVTVICPDGNGNFIKLCGGATEQSLGTRHVKMFGVNYLLINIDMWENILPEIVEEVGADILHNFGPVDLVSRLHVKPSRTVYTIDTAPQIEGKEGHLKDYDYVTTVSKAFAEDLLSKNNTLSEVLKQVDFRGITNGILSSVLSPNSGLMLPARYNENDVQGKQQCKDSVCKTYGISPAKKLFITMCRLVESKGVQNAIKALSTFVDNDAMLMVVGKGDSSIEDELLKYNRKDGLLWIQNWPSPLKCMPLFAAADFYLCPSVYESCGLMVMTACSYGAVPVTTLNGGLQDNMDDSVAVIIHDDNISDAVSRACILYDNRSEYEQLQESAMKTDFSWKTRNKEYVELYECNTQQ